jgi:CheY-like chemotaxis protein/HPt (histidine-containing phosphotransfer) domain-containing protein
MQSPRESFVPPIDPAVVGVSMSAVDSQISELLTCMEALERSLAACTALKGSAAGHSLQDAIVELRGVFQEQSGASTETLTQRNLASGEKRAMSDPARKRSEKELLVECPIECTNEPVGRIMPLSARVDGTTRPLILVAEDNLVNQKVAVLQLKELGYAMDIVANGNEAIAAAASKEYSLILMDCQMPAKDGFEATRAIRRFEKEKSRRVPIIALTASAVEGDRERCLAAGMDDYISKPVTPQKLKEAIERWLPSASVDTHKAIDVEALKREAGDDIAREILEVFMSSSRSILREIEQAICSENTKVVRATLRELSNSSTVLGAKRMAELAEQMDELAVQGRWALVAQGFSGLLSEFDAIDKCIAKTRNT